MTDPVSPSAAVCAQRRISRRRAFSVFLAVRPWLFAIPVAAAPPEAKFRLALSESLFSSVNPNDARAAMRIWLRKVSADLSLPVDIDGDIFLPSAQVLEKIRRGQVDAAGINALEFRAVSEYLDASHLICEADRLDSRYALLVKKDSGIQKLADLRGRGVVLQNSASMCLASPWISTLLFDERLEQPEQFFGSFAREAQGSRALLPVFFGKMDACVVSHRLFRTMGELNPQVVTQMTPLANSPDLVPTFHIMTKASGFDDRTSYLKALSSIQATEAGRQLMTLFQFDGLAMVSGEKILPTVALIAKAERARGMKVGANKWA